MIYPTIFQDLVFCVFVSFFSLTEDQTKKHDILKKLFFFNEEITIWDNYIFSSSIHSLSPSIYMFFSISVSTTTILMQDLKSHNWMSLIVDKTESFVSSLDS